MYKLFTIIFLLSLAFAGDRPAAAQEEEPVVDDDVRRCLSTRSIRSTHIIDDRNMLFYAPGRRVYHNILRQPCNGLKREGRFTYRITGGSLCSGDIIFVLHDDSFDGFRQGPSCSLGAFHEISREAADALREGPDAKVEAQPLPMPEPAEVGNGDEKEEEPEEPES